MRTGLPRPGLARSAHRGRITLLRGYVSKSSATLNPLTISITQLACMVAQSGHPLPLPSRFHFNRASTSIDLHFHRSPLPSVFHFHRTSTFTPLNLLQCACANTTSCTCILFESVSLGMPAPMASRFSSSASGAEGSDTRRTTRSEGK